MLFQDMCFYSVFLCVYVTIGCVIMFACVCVCLFCVLLSVHSRLVLLSIWVRMRRDVYLCRLLAELVHVFGRIYL